MRITCFVSFYEERKGGGRGGKKRSERYQPRRLTRAGRKGGGIHSKKPDGKCGEKDGGKREYEIVRRDGVWVSWE